VKSAKAIAEQSRVAIRNIRRDSLEELKKESANEKTAEDVVKKWRKSYRNSPIPISFK
jgi:ribosome recycling factor